MEHWEKDDKDKCKFLRAARRMKVVVRRRQKESCPACKEEMNLESLGVPYVWRIREDLEKSHPVIQEGLSLQI